MKLRILALVLLLSTFTVAKQNCSQFKTWQDANNYFKSKKEGYKSLDKDHDGTPCEHILRKEKRKKKKVFYND